MYARIIQVPLKPGTIPQAIEYFNNSVGPALKEMHGFKNSRLLTNPDTNQCLMVTLWESETARLEAETNGFLQGVLKDMGSYFAEKPTIDYYQVNVQVV
ncbi:hypothetical protein GCM10028806_04140 [Spirosoma terrae]|uniref:Uncharacterized protein n=1 Tax=Spirosoma terrae TaxID=1968276 RepID=A0A6L9LCQ3_9BACT|nr:antibiotic biosynthesis monooxygenase [Spirosoma terrae]NDU98345.1 hypothetical protein [Spirosoma terrae]